MIYLYGGTNHLDFIFNKYAFLKEKVTGIIISDEYQKEECSLPIYHLSEVVLSSDIGIILVMARQSACLVKNKLLKIGFENILACLYAD